VRKPDPVPISRTLSLLEGRRCLQQASFEHGLEHDLAMAKRQLHVGEGEALQRLGHEVLAPHRAERAEHALVEHVPGAHLLFDHVVAREFDVE